MKYKKRRRYLCRQQFKKLKNGVYLIAGQEFYVLKEMYQVYKEGKVWKIFDAVSLNRC